MIKYKSTPFIFFTVSNPEKNESRLDGLEGEVL